MEQIGNLEIYTYIIGGIITCVVTVFLISTFVGFAESRQPPGDIILAIATSDFILSIYWMMNGIYYFVDDRPPEDKGAFCQTTAYIAMLGATGQFVYSCAYNIILIVIIHDPLRPLQISRKFQIICHTVSVVICFGVPTFNISMNQMEANPFGVCSVELDANFIAFLVTLLVIYILLSIFILQRFKKQSRDLLSNNSFQRKILLRQIVYIISTIFTWSMIGVSLSIITFYKKGSISGLARAFVYIGNLSQIIGPIILSFVRYSDTNVCYAFWSFIKGKQTQSGDKLLEEWEGASLQDGEKYRNVMVKDLTKLSENMRKQQVELIIHNIGQYFNKKFGDYSAKKMDFDLKSIGGEETLGVMSVLVPHYTQQLVEHDRYEIKEESFRVVNNLVQIKNCCNINGGKSGQFFFSTYDEKWLLKSITKQEYENLLEFMPNFLQHLQNNPKSMISKLYGIFEFHLSESNLNQSVMLVLIRNILQVPRQYVERIYDLKGSNLDREVLKTPDIDPTKYTLKDIDFVKLERQIHIQSQQSQEICRILKEDSYFLSQLNLIDYSLLLAKVNWRNYSQEQGQSLMEVQNASFNDLTYVLPSSVEQGVYYQMSIIDYLQKYDFGKKAEKITKKIINANNKGTASVQNPTAYYQRFCENVLCFFVQ